MPKEVNLELLYKDSKTPLQLSGVFQLEQRTGMGSKGSVEHLPLAFWSTQFLQTLISVHRPSHQFANIEVFPMSNPLLQGQNHRATHCHHRTSLRHRNSSMLARSGVLNIS